MEMEMTKDELNKMTKNALLEHVGQHGMKPNNKSISKRNLIELIIQRGFNKPPPKREKSEPTKEERKAWNSIMGYMGASEKAHWIEEGRPIDHIYHDLRTINRFMTDEDDSDSETDDEPEHDKRIEESELDRKGKRLDFEMMD